MSLSGQSVNSPEGFHSRGIFSHLWRGLFSAPNFFGLVFLMTVMATAILAINAIWVITGSDQTLLSTWLSNKASLNNWVAFFAGFYGLVWLTGAILKKRALRILVYMITAWLVGVYLIRTAEPYIPYPGADFPFQDYEDVYGAFLFRLSFLAPLVPMLLVYFLIEKGDRSYPLRFGDLSKKTIVFNSKGKQTSWWAWLFRMWIFGALPLFLLFQWQVGFEPILSGKWLLFLIPIVLLALLNALSEDLLLQGFLLPNEAKIIAPGLAIFLHGMFFGLMHWGSAPDAISGLPMGLMIGFAVWMGSKATLETRGLGFGILVHMSADIAIFSAHFI